MAHPGDEQEPRRHERAHEAWLASKLAHVDTAALLERAPLDLRVNALKASRDDVLDELPSAAPTRFAPAGTVRDEFALFPGTDSRSSRSI